jgi:hypothetical protein
MEDTEGLQRVQLALAQAKKVRREHAFLIQSLAGLRDYLHPQEGQDAEENDFTVEG